MGDLVYDINWFNLFIDDIIKDEYKDRQYEKDISEAKIVQKKINYFEQIIDEYNALEKNITSLEKKIKLETDDSVVADLTMQIGDLVHAKENLTQSPKFYPTHSEAKAKVEILYAKLARMLDRLYEVFAFQKEFEKYSEKLKNDIIEVLAFVAPNVPFCRIDLSQFNRHKYDKVSFYESVKKGDKNAINDLKNFISYRLFEKEIEDRIKLFQGLSPTCVKFQKDERDKIVAILKNYFVNLEAIDIDFSVCDKSQFTVDDLSTLITGNDVNFISVLSQMLHIEKEILLKYISTINSISNEINQNYEILRNLEKQMDSRDNGMGFVDDISSQLQDEYAKIYKEKIKPAESQLKDNKLTVTKLRDNANLFFLKSSADNIFNR